ncbi:hypothetical protein CABS03_08555 [Colletotrichum abscissum]|uniref:Uncharacterized protein n=2 Tax=Colletotrichum abscissum TaxID=1671311 RepID=A0A9P9XR69_9PEZI|nr:hypothetical protein CABS02_01104 [Colletotrichum abscissum]
MPNSSKTISIPMRDALFACFKAATTLVRPGLRQHVILVGAGLKDFTVEADGKIAFDAPQGFRVRMDVLEIGNGCIERIHATESFLGGSVASTSDLLRLRAKTVVERGGDGEVDDFRWLLLLAARNGHVLPLLDNDEVENLVGAAAILMSFDVLILVALLGVNNSAAAGQLLERGSVTEFIMLPTHTLTSFLIWAGIASPAKPVTCPSSSELRVTIPPSHQSPSNTDYESLAEVHDALIHCPNITSLNLRIGEIGCVGEPDRWSLPLDPAGTSRYLPVLDTLSLEKYHFYDTDGDYLHPLRGWTYLSAWIWSGDAFGWLKWRLLPDDQKSVSNTELWLDAMDFSKIRNLSILDYDGPPETLVESELPLSLPSLRTLRLERNTTVDFGLSLPPHSLHSLSWLDAGQDQSIIPILERHGRSLTHLEWRTPESLESKRPALPSEVMRDLRNLAPNLQSLTIDLNRNGTWPWEDLRALSLGLPAGLTNLTLYLEIASECRRQQGPYDPVRCEDACGPVEQLASPLLTATSALQVARFIRHYAKSPLASINFFAGDWTRPWDGPINVPTWLDGRRSWVACGTNGGEDEGLRCSGMDTALGEHEIELFRALCVRMSADLSDDITAGHPQDFVEQRKSK